MFKGVCTALVTPFDENLQVNYKVLKNIINKQIDAGVSALLVLGTTGESPTLTEKEKMDIVKFAVNEVRARVPVYVGAGTNCTETTIANIKKYESLGVDGVLLVAPYYNKPTQNGLCLHFKEIAKSTNIPIILYNVPSRTGVNMEPKTICELSKIKNIVAVKQASSSMTDLMEIVANCQEDFSVYSGDDDLTFAMMSLGAKGVISVASNVEPQFMSELCQNFFDGNFEKSRKMQLMINPLIKGLFCETNPIPVKYAMKLCGDDVGGCRLPLTTLCNKENVCLRLKDFQEKKLCEN